jgi:small subunit ribosomal protein S6
MRKYETFFIVDPDLPDEMNSVVDEKFQSIVTSNGGNVLTYVPWGKKKLAYPVKKHTRGLYVLMEYAGGSELVAELERNMRLDERIIKFITVKLDDRFDPEKEEARKEVTPPVFGEDEDSEARAAGPLDEEEEGAEAGEEFDEGEEE